MKTRFHIAVACGGTGGHIFPGLATARALRERGHHVTLWLSGKEVEHAALKGWKGPVVTIPSEGFQYGPLRSVLTVFRIVLATGRCWVAMVRHRPDAVLAMGSYSSIGPCLAARLRGIPYILHEANAIPGKAVRLLAKGSAATALCFEEARYQLKGIHAVATGMPLRPELMADRVSAEHSPSGPGGLDEAGEEFCLLVMGGSGGARPLNEVVSLALCRLAGICPTFKARCKVVHLTGPVDQEWIAQRYRNAGIDAEVNSFRHDMVALYRDATLAICRAGASTCAELGIFGVPALLVPYPFAAGDHQTANARALEKKGAADVVQQADLSEEWLADYILSQMENPDRLRRMAGQSRSRNVPLDAAQRLADLVERYVYTDTKKEKEEPVDRITG